jgi:actin-related protein
LSSRQQAFSISSERPPVILEWTSFLIRVGYAEQCKPQHIIPWTTDNTKHQHQHTPKSEKEWYNIVGPLLERIWNHMLLLSSATSSATSSSSSNTSTRRVVVLHPPYMERTWETAMYQGLWNLGVPGIVFINALEMVPIAMGWSRGMVIQVGMNETWCMAHVDGHGLTNTLQGKSLIQLEGGKKNCAHLFVATYCKRILRKGKKYIHSFYSHTCLFTSLHCT